MTDQSQALGQIAKGTYEQGLDLLRHGNPGRCVGVVAAAGPSVIGVALRGVGRVLTHPVQGPPVVMQCS